MNKRLRVLFAVSMVSIFLILTACSGGKGSDAADPTSTDGTLETSETPNESSEPTPKPYAAPLTGIGLDKDALNRPIAIMINNYSAARPQSGLTGADVVWEVLAEGGITRLIAIFQSTDSLTNTIGPIRSNRAYLIDVADSYRAIMAHAGGSPEAYSILKKQRKPYLDEISNAGTYFWRSKDRKAPHNLYSNLEKLREGAEKRKYTDDQPPLKYTFSSDGTITGTIDATAELATNISISFLTKGYKVGYIFDQTSGLYKRSINEEPHIDLNNNEQLSATNLIVLEARHKTLDNVGRLSVDLESGGSAYLFQKGKKIDIDWVRSPDGMVRFSKDGTEITLLVGKTYIHVVPNQPALSEHVSWVTN
ncbi:DUF3048 domain-containing protein [Paenibacillus sp. GSMTC-2017]|uniref:DUF3048 domain-containing protein n=1 Tax=Paenibacillus sp. GSMTC-2017 TaxID=2794350 RepID=UPI0018D98CFE|nr:DUF3048 domain-containing protein [Paenibacillus sp. GSMTC-2017]MBH5319018.1 DUF3048 domain-containing protein [Paenibacillus sp. GSMTC-2017]